MECEGGKEQNFRPNFNLYRKTTLAPTCFSFQEKVGYNSKQQKIGDILEMKIAINKLHQ